MEKNIILAGVGGQGILSIAFVLDNAALEKGYSFKQAEVHGMAQRGGAVQSHLRYSDETVSSDLIPHGRADLVLSVEPLEAKRYWDFLSPEGWVVTSVTPYRNIDDYPADDDLLRDLARFPRLIAIDTGQLAKAAGNKRAENMVAVGAASTLLDFEEELLLKYVEALFARKGDKIVSVNRKAFALGRAVGRFYRGLTDAGLDPIFSLELCRKLEPETIDPAYAERWAESLGADASKLERIMETEGSLACDQVV